MFQVNDMSVSKLSGGQTIPFGKMKFPMKKSALQDLFKTFFRIQLSFLKADVCHFVINQTLETPCISGATKAIF